MSDEDPTEVWLPIPGHEGYEASCYGRIRNATTHHVLRPQWTSKGYLKVHLGRRHQEGVHRLVCLTWHGPPDLPSDHADHIDFNPTNNSAGNLRWLSASLNSGRQVRFGPRGWERVCDEEPPENHAEPTDAERAATLAAINAAGWADGHS